MKKILVAIGLLLVASHARADENYPRVWRSSNTASTEYNQLIASGPVILHRVMVNTAATGFIQFFNAFTSTGSVRGYENIDTASTGPMFAEYDVLFSSGLMYGKSGAANVTVIWDYQSTIPPGLDARGKR